MYEMKGVLMGIIQREKEKKNGYFYIQNGRIKGIYCPNCKKDFDDQVLYELVGAS